MDLFLQECKRVQESGKARLKTKELREVVFCRKDAKSKSEGVQETRVGERAAGGRLSQPMIAMYLLNINGLLEYRDCESLICHFDRPGVNASQSTQSVKSR